MSGVRLWVLPESKIVYKLKVSMSRKIFASLAAAVLLAAPYLDPQLFPLAWVAFVPLLWGVHRAGSFRHAVLCGWLMGVATYLLGFHWLVYTISVFGGFAYPISVVVFLLYAILHGLQLAIFAALVRSVGFGPLQIFPALFWVALEFGFPLLFPWYLANSQFAFASFLQTADLVGPYGASFVLMWFNASVYGWLSAVRYERLARLAAVACAALLALGSVLYGYQRLETVGTEMAAAPKLPMAAVQGNVDIDLKWDPALAQRNLEKHKALTIPLAEAPLVIWPESAIEAWLPEDLLYLPDEMIPKLNAESRFVFGARSFRGKPGSADFRAFNSAFLTDGEGRVLARYHKQVLLAFGEYVPFARLLSLLPGMPLAEGFTPGTSSVAFDLPGGVRAAPLICYEDLMPALSRRFVRETGANVLLNLTNDAWYGMSVGPWQHAWLAQLRAIETRRSLLRVTNTGVTALINAKGELLHSLPMFVPEVLKTEVEILEGQTPYVRFGDWFAWTATLLSVGLLAGSWRRRFVSRN